MSNKAWVQNASIGVQLTHPAVALLLLPRHWQSPTVDAESGVQCERQQPARREAVARILRRGSTYSSCSVAAAAAAAAGAGAGAGS